MPGECNSCGKNFGVRAYNGGMNANASANDRSFRVNSKISLCFDCYERRLIEVQTKYWKDHLAEEKLRSGA